MAEKKCSCPEFRKADYEGRTLNFEGRTFFRRPVPYFFSVPMGIEKRMAEAGAAIEKAGLILAEPPMVLVKEGAFSGEILIEVLPPEQDSPDLMTFPVSAVEATVYERKDPRIAPGVKAFTKRLSSQGKVPKGIYLWHIGCPACNVGIGFRTVIFAWVG